MKRSLLGPGILAFIAFAPPSRAQSPATSPWLPVLPVGVGPVGVTAPQGPEPTGGEASTPYDDLAAPAAAGPLAAAPGAVAPGAAGPTAAAGPAAAVPGASAPAADGQLTPQQLFEHVTRGVVALERNGVPMAIGTVLSGDGRVLTALSGLAGGDGADVRYSDGTVVHAKVGRSDRGSDLALLVPTSLKWTEGLLASDTDPAGQELRAMLPAHGAHLGPAVAAVKGQIDAHARDGAALLRMLDVDVKGVPVAGAPLLDSSGGVVGVLVRACKGAPAAPSATPEEASGTWYPTSPTLVPPALAKTVCKPVVMGAPVAAIRSFLTHPSATPATPAPWLGIRGEPEQAGSVRGVRVVAVAPSSPAEKAALKPTTDLIVAVDGHPIDTPEKLADLIGKHLPGDSVKLLVYAGDQFREVGVALRAAP